jgi:hypothetical protein
MVACLNRYGKESYCRARTVVMFAIVNVTIIIIVGFEVLTAVVMKKQARNQREIRRQARWRRYVPSKRQLTFNWLHGVISQKIVLFNYYYYYYY